MLIESTGKNLIFLISQPRAGSTMLQRILGSHPEIHTTAEPWIMLPLIYTLRIEGIHTEYDQNLAVAGISDYLTTLPAGKDAYDDAVRTFVVNLYQQACSAAGKTRFLDKTPRYYLILDDLYRLFPQAKFVILFRHPLAVLNSVLETWVKETWILLGRYRSDLLVAPPRLLKAVAQHQTSTFSTSYEELVSQPEQTVASIFNFLGLTFAPSYLNYGQSARPEGKLGDQNRVNNYNQPVSERMNRWIQLGDRAQTRHFALAYLSALGDRLVGQMGYSAKEARHLLRTKPLTDQSFEIDWDNLMATDSPLRSRMYYAELALLEHRRFVLFLRRLRARLGI